MQRRYGNESHPGGAPATGGIRWAAVAGCVLAALMAFSAIAWCDDEASEEKGSWEDYKVISERNIFSRNRRVRTATPAQEEKKTPAVTRSEQSYYVLRGVAREKDVFISFIEDSRYSSINRVRVGETVGGGTILDATLDAVSFDLEGAVTQVEIGKTLEGQTPAASSQYSYGGSYYTQPSTYSSTQSSTYSNTQQSVSPATQTVVSDDEAKDILQRLKERRKKELGE